MSRTTRLLLALLAASFLATFAPRSLYREPVPPAEATIAARAVPLDDHDPARRRVGRLLYLGGWALRSNDKRFGGISAMHVEEGGVTALSDEGLIFRFALPGAGSPRLTMLPLPEGPGSPTVKGDRDAEAMVVQKKRAWIAFEGRNQIWRYSTDDWASKGWGAPEQMKRWSINSGAEAMVRLPDGRFLIFSEGGARAGPGSDALLFERDPSREAGPAQLLRYMGPEGYRITDAAVLPDGRLLLLNRRFAVSEGIAAKLTLTDGPLAEGVGVIRAREIAHLQPPLTVDNMEALSVTRENGRTIVWIGSDDNFIPLQRTLLMKFALEP